MENLNKYKRWNTQLHLYNNLYWDFVLSQDTTPYKNADGNAISKEDCLSAYLDFSNIDCLTGDTVLSLSKNIWNKAVSEPAVLKDYGLTGIDNGIIPLDNTISNKQYYDLITKSYLKLDGDKRLQLKKVGGNTAAYVYPIEYVEDGGFYRLKGGFFQGFFKLFGFNYQVLPQYIENEWNLEFVLRPQKLIEDEKTINSKNHNKNKGIFFYMGTRAENKFAEFYDANLDDYQSRTDIDCHSSDYFSFDWEDDGMSHELFKAQFFAFLFLAPFNYEQKTPCGGCFPYSDNEAYKEMARECERYFADGYFKFDDDFERFIETSDGANIKQGGYHEIQTDNKFLTYDRTPNGLTTDNDNGDTIVKLYEYTKKSNENKFLTYYKGKGGKVAGDEEDEPYKYDIKKDIGGNAFALRITEDGRIGYRYMVRKCGCYGIIEEYSFPGTISNCDWSVINTKLQIINGNTDDCGVPMGERKMRIMIYVNGSLVFISKELPEFDFKELDEIYTKQEGVPFNISLGGGTQGLSEAWKIYERRPFEKILPLESNFAGTFIGDIKSFKFYTCPMTYPEIKNNYLFEKQKL